VLPVQGRTAGGSRPALATGVFLLVASLVLPVPSPSGPPSAPSSFLIDVLVQGRAAGAAVAAVGGQPLADLPLVDGLLARVPAAGFARLARWPGVRAVTDANRRLRLRAADPTAGDVDGPAQPASPSATVPLRGASLQEAAVAPARPAAQEAAVPPAGPAAAAGRGVAVGVLDTGVAAAGDLAGRVVASADLSGEGSFIDAYGHGTFMAGLIAGSGRAGGPAGVAPAADLVDLKVAGADGTTSLGQVLAAMQLAAASRDHFNLRVLNVSLGAPAGDPAAAPLTEAVERLWAAGITVVAAAGNDGGAVDAPGRSPYVVTVGALDATRHGGLAGAAVPAWSSRGPDAAGRAKPDLVAPGVGLVSLRLPGSTVDLANPAARVGDAYFRGSGTSMATALVAGAAARVAAAHPGWGPDQVKAALTGTASPLGRPAPAGSGAGALDLEAALGVASVRPANGDLPGLPAAGRGGPAPGTASLGWRAGAWTGLRWLPGTGTGSGGGLQALEPFLRSGGRLLARNWLARSWLARSWLTQGWTARSWMARSWDAAGG
jgi:serine protease AprX